MIKFQQGEQDKFQSEEEKAIYLMNGTAPAQLFHLHTREEYLIRKRQKVVCIQTGGKGI